MPFGLLQQSKESPSLANFGASGKEDVPDSLLLRYPRDPDAPDTECLAGIKEAASDWSGPLFSS